MPVAEPKLMGSKCPSCGGKINYSAENQKLQCSYCGFKEDINRANTKVIETQFNDKLECAEEMILEEHTRKVLQCDSCSAEFSLDIDQVKVVCAFCGSEHVHEQAFQHKTIQPVGIIPFYIGEKEAKDMFHKWLKQGWFHPSALRKTATLDILKGIYMPFWTFDFQVDA
ncbi:MAG: hypothetical protein M3Q56_13485, partial [Bacteroidota bacterium]|nr:hypothetical protein [Bacteroidota bacterium]